MCNRFQMQVILTCVSCWRTLAEGVAETSEWVC